MLDRQSSTNGHRVDPGQEGDSDRRDQAAPRDRHAASGVGARGSSGSSSEGAGSCAGPL